MAVLGMIIAWALALCELAQYLHTCTILVCYLHDRILVWYLHVRTLTAFLVPDFTVLLKIIFTGFPFNNSRLQDFYGVIKTFDWTFPGKGR